MILNGPKSLLYLSILTLNLNFQSVSSDAESATNDVCSSVVSNCNAKAGNDVVSAEEPRKKVSKKQIYANLKKDVAKIRQICGQLCDFDVQGVEGSYFDHIDKEVDCKSLFETDIIDKPGEFHSPPARIPKYLIDDFTYHKRATVSHRYYDDNAGVNHMTNWTEEVMGKYFDAVEKDILAGNYGAKAVRDIQHHLKYEHFDVTGHHVLVIGTQRPWLETVLLHSGAKHVTVVDYVKIYTYHPKITTLTVQDMRQMYLNGTMPKFDSMVTYSSVEHSGLGRYGDNLNPWGDIIAMARAWCLLEKGTKALVGIPVGPDILQFNGARIYGPKMLPHLFANWKQVDTAMDLNKFEERCVYCYQPIFVLEK